MPDTSIPATLADPIPRKPRQVQWKTCNVSRLRGGGLGRQCQPARNLAARVVGQCRNKARLSARLSLPGAARSATTIQCIHTLSKGHPRNDSPATPAYLPALGHRRSIPPISDREPRIGLPLLRDILCTDTPKATPSYRCRPMGCHVHKGFGHPTARPALRATCIPSSRPTCRYRRGIRSPANDIWLYFNATHWRITL